LRISRIGLRDRTGFGFGFRVAELLEALVEHGHQLESQDGLDARQQHTGLTADLRRGLFECLAEDLHAHRPRAKFREPALSSLWA
jgi:hypothetical protein